MPKNSKTKLHNIRPTPRQLTQWRAIIQRALVEDATRHDVTGRLLTMSSTRIQARIEAGNAGVIAGMEAARLAFALTDRRIQWTEHVSSGERVDVGTCLATVLGPARGILAAERTALNLLMHLSGIATLTHAYVSRAKRVRIFDTRKTSPGLRDLEKYAVRVGGGYNHRRDLEEHILIKENHFRAARSTAGGASVKVQDSMLALVERAKAHARKSKNMEVQVEVTSTAELRVVLPAQPDLILLDNMRPPQLRRAVQMRRELHCRKVPLEATGGVTLRNVAMIAATGVDRISVGAITHSAPVLSCAMEVEEV